MSDGGTIRVLIVDDIADTCDNLEKLLYFEKDIEVVGKAYNGVEAVAQAKDKQPDVILMDINMPEMDGITATETILQHDSAIQVIIMSVQGETDYLRRAMMAGAREFLVKPVSADDLYKSIRHVYTRGQSRPRMVASGSSAANADASPQTRGKLFAVYSPKGGAGTSVVAANLAIALRAMTQKKIALVDGNLTLGDLSVMLNLISERTIVQLAERVNDIDRDLLNDVLATHPSQIRVLLAPPNPQDGEQVTAEHIGTILDALLLEYDYVVVDTPSSFQDRALTILDKAERIVLLMTLEMTCIKNIKLFLEVAGLLQYPPEKLMLVLNKADNRMGIKVESIENNIQHKVALQIANAPYEITLSINQGVPIIIGKRDHRVATDIYRLARELAQADAHAVLGAKGGEPAHPAEPAQSVGFLGRLFRKT